MSNHNGLGNSIERPLRSGPSQRLLLRRHPAALHVQRLEVATAATAQVFEDLETGLVTVAGVMKLQRGRQLPTASPKP